MPPQLPPLRLTGAQVLRGGLFVSRSVALADGRLCRGPLPAIDLSGRLLLPGLVDLCAGALEPEGDVAAALAGRARAAAAAGITTAWLALPWGPGAAAALGVHAGCRAGLPVDLRLKLVIGADAAGDPRLLPAIVRHRIDYLVFEGPGAITPALCALAEALDRLGVRYASRGDADGAARERYRRIGAAIAEHPASAEAAAAARAMMSPVVAAPGKPGSAAADALASAGALEALLGAAVRRAPPRPLAQGVEAVARAPAELLGLIDRGRLEPGARADVIVVDPATLSVEATIAGGRLVHAGGPAADHIRAAAGCAAH